MNKEIEMYKNEGFKGFISVKDLRKKLSEKTSGISTEAGIYIVVRDNDSAPSFESVGTGGHHKGKNPNVDIATLQDEYVNDSKIVYIGQSTNLRRRIRELLHFGVGKNIGHWGGRYLWQLSDAEDLLVAWKEMPGQDVVQEEKSMLKDFIDRHDRPPFANLK